MLGAYAYGELAFGEFVEAPLDSDAFQDFLDDVDAERCWLLEIDAFSLASSSARSSAFGDSAFGELAFGELDAGTAAGLVTLPFSTHGYISRIFTGGLAGGDPADRKWYDGRVQSESIQIERALASKEAVAGWAECKAEIALINNDAGLDDIPNNYSLDGRRAQIWVGSPDWKRSDFGLVFSGVVKNFTAGVNTLRLQLSDGVAKLDRMVDQTVYAGTGTLEGGADLKGKYRPRAFGVCRNVAPPLVLAASLIYQVNDGAISDVPAVYDRQVVLVQGTDYPDQATMLATPPAAGQYRVWKAGGYFRLGSTPAGTVTADVYGDATGSYVKKHGEIIQRLLISVVGLTNSEVDPASIAQLNSDQAADCGIWSGTDGRSVKSMVDELLISAGAVGGFSRQSAFTVFRVSSPAGRTPAASYTSEQIKDLAREPLPSAVDPIAWRVSVGSQRNYTVQMDVAAAVTDARRTFAAEALRYSKLEDTTIKSRYLLAAELAVPALFDVAADGDTEAARLNALWTVKRGLYRVALPLAALTSDIGKVLQIAYSRYGLGSGIAVLVLGYNLRGPDTVELTVLA